MALQILVSHSTCQLETECVCTSESGSKAMAKVPSAKMSNDFNRFDARPHPKVFGL